MSETPEKNFLHDISNPLATAIFSVDLLLEELSEIPGLEPSLIENLKRTAVALTAMQTQIERRRSELKKGQGTSSATRS